MSDYSEFLDKKMNVGSEHGFEPIWMPDFLFDFQKALVDWAIKKGRAAIFADCGLGKTPMFLVWAENIVRKTNGRILILTPLAVSAQTIRESEKFGIEAKRSREGELLGKIIVTNYERLHYFNPNDFVGCVCDESSILKNFAGKTREAITEFVSKLPYRLLCTATAAPNDYMELGTSSEALGYLRRVEMLGMYFSHKSDETQKWTLKGHATSPFWAWVCSWARAIRMPQDLGFDNGDFVLPPLTTELHVIRPKLVKEGFLFDIPSLTLNDQREERRRTITERCEKTAALISSTKQPVVCWGHLNDECDLIEKLVPDAVQVSGSDCDDRKEEVFTNFSSGNVRALVTKPVIGAWGLNWQHCAHQTFFPSHSFEQYYQAVRRSWRFGQKKPVKVDVICSEGESNVMRNMQRKAIQADQLFAKVVSMMTHEIGQKERKKLSSLEFPKWL